MASDLDLAGVLVPIITPYARDGSVAVDAVRTLCDELLDAGAAGIVALGTTGEAPMLDRAESAAVVAACADVCAPRGAVLVVGAGTIDTRHTIELHRELADVPGITASLCVTPYYVRPSEAQIVEHLRMVAAESPVPVIAYNIPYRTGRGLGSAALLELAQVPGVVGVKQSVGGVDADTLEVLAAAPRGFHLFAGDDAFIYPVVLMGGSGAIAASAHVCTERFVAMVECGLAGKVDDGRALSASLLPVATALFTEPNPAVIKGVLHAQGRIPTPTVRRPLGDASPEAVAHALAAIDAIR
jgi:4-hydroxy-tetrahydrodipicolinate synthase